MNLTLLCLCGMGGHLFTTRAYQVYDAAKLAPFHYLEIAVWYFCDIVVLDNEIDTLSIIGTVLIVSVSLALAKNTHKEKDEKLDEVTAKSPP